MYYGPPDEDEELIVTDKAILDSPFIDLTNAITEYEKFKMVFLFPILVIRIILTFILKMCALQFMYFEKISGLDMYKPVHNLFNMYLVISGVWTTVKGKENFNEFRKIDKNGIIVHNHISFIDPFIMAVTGLIAGLTIKQYKSVPIYGTLFTYIKTIFFDSNKTGNSNLIKERMNEPLNRFPLIIAPEGGLSNGRVLLQFKNGAFIHNVPILPTIIHYRDNKHFIPSWTIDNPFFTGYRFLTQFITYATVEYLPIMYQLDTESIEEFKERVRSTMAEALGVPTIELTIKDKIEFAKKYKLSSKRDCLLYKDLKTN